ncbi:GntR family transcriptional regulator [Leucobacter allii]|uniref:GntR family transcriptional regulator n=1 Tax=Leucobacter allii TaxID=2932247 RepID=A0ABY4FIQ5_9MICO|nr:GntR family transcriptional regulator [Leucobacter allii]UOQ56285.1 GntR family transcriptional regulator [Leucobacter allii]
MLIGPQNDSSADRVLQGMRADIVSGALPGGARLIERELAEQYGVSRLPVREAIRWLILEGLIDRSPRHGGVVHAMDRADVADIAELHGPLDRLTARQAALRAPAADAERFRAELAVAERAAAAGDRAASGRVIQELRSLVFAATGNRPLREIQQALESRTMRMFTQASRLALDPFPHFHRLADALAARDPGGADAAMAALGAHIAEARAEHALIELTDGGDTASGYGTAEAAGLLRERIPYTPGFVLVRDAVRDQIVARTRRPGTVISGRLLAVEFDVSRYPALEAIEALAYEGLVTLGSARVASRVRSLGAEEAEDLFDVAAELDALAAGFAARRPAPQELASLHRIVVAEQSAIAHDPASAHEPAFAFLRQMYEMTGNRVLVEMGRKLEGRRRMVLAASPVDHRTARGHEQLLRAISSRDGALAATLYRRAFADPEYRSGILGAARLAA